jgi:hypothetical protein
VPRESEEYVRTILSRTGLLVGAVTLALATTAGPAAAAPDHTGAPTITITTEGIPAAVLRAAAEQAPKQTPLTSHATTRGVDVVITCPISSDYPHKSTTTPGAVDGKAKTSCDAPVPDLRAQGELYRYLDGYGFTLVGIGSLDYQFNSPGPVSSAAFDLCWGTPQYYYTRGIHSVVFPANFTPPSASGTTQSPVIQVTC